jgi:FMN phosphatase YigB (HAD superfamily)
LLRALGLPLDFIGISGVWGVHKPAPAFFDRIVEACGCAPGEIAYVGDRLDNDIRPAAAAGMVTVFLRRGPWGYLQAAQAEATRVDLRLDSLDQLPRLLG